MGNLSVKCLLFREKIILESQSIKLNHRDLSKTYSTDTYIPVFEPDDSTTMLVAKMCTNYHENSIKFRFLWLSATFAELEVPVGSEKQWYSLPMKTLMPIYTVAKNAISWCVLKNRKYNLHF